MKKILIADDDESIRFILKEILDKEKYLVYEAKNGEQTLGISLEINPDILLLDINMPKMLGYDVVKILREKNYQSKIIIFSAESKESNIRKGHVIGSDYYIQKPFDLFELQSLINELAGVI